MVWQLVDVIVLESVHRTPLPCFVFSAGAIACSVLQATIISEHNRHTV